MFNISLPLNNLEVFGKTMKICFHFQFILKSIPTRMYFQSTQHLLAMASMNFIYLLLLLLLLFLLL